MYKCGTVDLWAIPVRLICLSRPGHAALPWKQSLSRLPVPDLAVPRRSEILVMLGENGTGKTTFIRMLHGSLTPDEEGVDLPEFRVSYKPQKICPKFPGSVRALTSACCHFFP